MLQRVQRNIGAGAILLAAMLLAGCASIVQMNTPLQPEKLQGEGPISVGGYRFEAVAADHARDVLVLLSFSGGGKRSAAFGYGVLRGLRDFPVARGNRQTHLLDEVDMMTSVSGGSFPAAYYGLYRNKIFEDFEKDFLNQDIEAYIYGTYLLPWHLAAWLFDSNYGTNDRMASIYDRLMFHGATYADMLKAGEPFVSINATDVDHQLVFPFSQDQFDLICSDLSSYPVARAVAASNGFPVLFTPITLKSYRPQCNGREPFWMRSDTDSGNPLSRTQELARTRRFYLNADATQYVHLMDGGISDNLALRTVTNAILLLTRNDGTTAKRVDLTGIRRILLISADGQAESDGAGARQKHLSSISQIFGAVSSTQIDSYNFETMLLAREQIDAFRDLVRRQRCAKGPTAADGHPCGDVESYFAHLSLAGITDETARKRLQKIPTGLTLDPKDIALLVTAGETQVKESPDLAAFRDDLAKN